MAVGSLVLLIFGSPSPEPGPGELIDAVRSLGLRPRRIERLDRIAAVVYYGLTEIDASPYIISLRTPDERDADLLDRTYRGLRFRASEVDAGYSTLKRRVEHEALMLTLAERGGVRVPSVAHVGTTARGSAFLVTREMPTRPVTEADLHAPEVLRSLWAELLNLHRAVIAHRRLTLAAINLDATGRVWLSDFDGAQTAPSDREAARDVAALLTETAIVIGPHAAVAAAVATMGPERVAPALRMLQPLALPPATRKRAKAVPGLLDDLRREVNEATGEPGLELEQLERFKPRTLLIIGAGALAFYSLLPQLTNLSSTFEAFGNAHPAWIAAALLASAVTYLFAAVAFQGAVADPLPFVPDVRLQVASSFTSLLGPAGAGGFALKGRFLQRVGVGGPEAAASVAVGAIGGFAVHIVLLIGFILWRGQSDVGGFSLPDSTTLLLVLAVVLALVGVLIAIGPTRQRVMVPAWRAIKTGLGQIGQVFRRPVRVAALFGGSAALTLTYVTAMACSIQAYGGGLSIPQIGAGYLAAVAIATLAPTPGGLGALESALIAAFTGFGLPDGVAVSSVLTFRLATFWLPILPGWLALGWMQRNDEA
jgi:undecaprenyl-diphosphatase